MQTSTDKNKTEKQPDLFTMTDAKNRIVEILNIALSGDKAYVMDKAGQAFMTAEPCKILISDGVDPIAVSVTTFKANFSRFAHLVKCGAMFRVQLAKGRSVIVRRHSRYRDPLQRYVDAVATQLRK